MICLCRSEPSERWTEVASHLLGEGTDNARGRRVQSVATRAPALILVLEMAWMTNQAPRRRMS